MLTEDIKTKMMSDMNIVEQHIKYIGKNHVYIIIQKINDSSSTFNIHRRCIGNDPDSYVSYILLEKETRTWEWVRTLINLDAVIFESIDTVMEEIGKWEDIKDD